MIKRNDGVKITAAALAVLSAQVGISLCAGSVFVCTAFMALSCLILHVTARWINPATALAVGIAVPVAGHFLGLFPGFGFILAAAIANGIMVSVAVLFQNRSMLVGIFVSSAARFVYCWVMVLRLMPLLPGAVVPETMKMLFFWPQLTGSIIGGVLALPLLFFLQLKQERPPEPPRP